MGMANNMAWMSEEGFSDADFLTQRLSAVISAHLRPTEPNLDFLLEMDGKDHARTIANAADDGRSLEETRNSDSSTNQTVKQLEKFRALCMTLVDHVDLMQTTAVYRLSSEGVNFADLRAKLDTSGEHANHALSSCDGAAEFQGSSRRRKKKAARMVTEYTADCYTALTGNTPTFTVNSSNSTVSGKWIDFLTAVFEALNIDDSPEGETQALMEKKRSLKKKAIKSILNAK